MRRSQARETRANETCASRPSLWAHLRRPRVCRKKPPPEQAKARTERQAQKARIEDLQSRSPAAAPWESSDVRHGCSSCKICGTFWQSEPCRRSRPWQPWPAFLAVGHVSPFKTVPLILGNLHILSSPTVRAVPKG